MPKRGLDEEEDLPRNMQEWFIYTMDAEYDEDVFNDIYEYVSSYPFTRNITQEQRYALEHKLRAIPGPMRDKLMWAFRERKGFMSGRNTRIKLEGGVSELPSMVPEENPLLSDDYKDMDPEKVREWVKNFKGSSRDWFGGYADVRKKYLKIAMRTHPDKKGKEWTAASQLNEKMKSELYAHTNSV